jgi:hypothetical protein
MDKALVFGTKDCRFESCQGHVVTLLLASSIRWFTHIHKDIDCQSFHGQINNNQHNTIGYIAQWLERLTADQQVPGSNPGVPF